MSGQLQILRLIGSGRREVSRRFTYPANYLPGALVFNYLESAFGEMSKHEHAA